MVQETRRKSMLDNGSGFDQLRQVKIVEFWAPTAHTASMRAQIALVCLGGFLGSCAESVPSLDPPIDPAPNYRAIIAKNLRSSRVTPPSDPRLKTPEGAASAVGINFFDERGNIFSDPKKVGSIEVADSQRQELNDAFGWTWMTCIRAQGGEINGTFAVFISGNAIVDSRRSILTDRCEGLKYQPLDLRPPEVNPVVKKHHRDGNE
jgi:hypothetical protein